MNNKKELAAYVRNNVEFFEERLQWALDKMDRTRCPLSFADEELFNDIVNAIEEWCDDHEAMNPDAESIIIHWDKIEKV